MGDVKRLIETQSQSENTMTNTAKQIAKDLNKAYTGKDDITLSQALARIAAEMYDPYNKFDNETGVYVETNSHQWEQFFLLQNIANNLWGSLYDTRTNKKGYVKGAVHKLKKANNNLELSVAKHDGSEISVNSLNQAADWVDRLKEKVRMFEDMYHTVADMMGCATGIDHKPYEPWTTAVEEKPEASSDQESELQARLAEMGINISVGHVANTNGIETAEEDVA